MSKFYYLLLLWLPLLLTAQTTDRRYLSGTGADDTVDWEFYCSDGAKSDGWYTLPVPSCWEQFGFGAYNYGHVPFEERLNESGRYRHTFSMDSQDRGLHHELVFDGVMTEAHVTLNGTYLGVHRGAFQRFRFDVTDVLKYSGENLLEVTVHKHSDNQSVNQAERKADYWVFGGIFRPVFLESKPPNFVNHVAINATANGSFHAQVELVNTPPDASLEVWARHLPEGNLRQMATLSALPDEASLDTFHLRGKFPAAVHPWTPEDPQRYLAEFRLVGSGGDILHRHHQKFGFRSVEIRVEDGIYVNGTKVKLKGVNRHSFHPDFGRTTSKAISIQHVNLMKDMNMNAVRMSHYQPDEHFLDVCDSLGLFVLDELAGWQKPSYDDTVGEKLLVELIRKDVNHPSIILWDNANEGGWNRSYDHLFGVHDIQKREVLHPWEYFGKFNTAHYISYNYLSRQRYEGNGLFLPTEFLHGLYDGGHGAGLEDYWFRMWNDPRTAGGFLWVFADEAIKRSDNGELDSDGNHAPDGILGPYLEKEGSFFTIRDIWSPVQLRPTVIRDNWDTTLLVENRYHFTDLANCLFIVGWQDPKGEGKGLYYRGTTVWDTLAPFSLSPGATGRLSLAGTNTVPEAKNLYLRVIAPSGRLIQEKSWALQSAAQMTNYLLPPKEATASILFSEEATNKRIRLRCGERNFIFNSKNGQLIQVFNSGGDTSQLLNGPQIVGARETEAPWDVKHGENEAGYYLEFTRDGQRIYWQVRPDQTLGLTVSYVPRNKTPSAGITFDYDQKITERVVYLGNGPYRVWKNRTRGPIFGRWVLRPNQTITGHSGFEYPEFSGYRDQLYAAGFRNTSGADFTVYNQTPNIFLKLWAPEEAPQPARTHVDHPPGDIGFMHGIPPIGTKFKPASELGPQSQAYDWRGNRWPEGRLSLSLLFDFGSAP